MTDVLLATPSIAQEPELVRAASGAGLTVLRRCIDAADLLAAAAAAPDAMVVVCAGLPRLSTDVVDRLGGGRRLVVGLTEDTAADTALADLGIDLRVRPAGTPAATWRAVVGSIGSAPPDEVPTGVWSMGYGVGATPVSSRSDEALGRLGPPVEPVAAPPFSPATAPGASRPHAFVAVWGPQGAPGRTTVAIALADALAVAGRTVCLVDADTYAPSIATALGLDDTASDLVVACRCAENRSVGPAALAALARPVRGSLVAVGGLAQPTRWAELRPGALDRLWAACRDAFDVTVVDIGFCLEHQDQAGPFADRRNAAAVTAMATADVVVAVADGSAHGVARLGTAWPETAALVAGRPTVLVRNRARDRGGSWRRAVAACGVDAPVVDLPDDAGAVAACWARGATLAEAAGRSRLRRAVAGLASTCTAAWA